MRYKNFKPLYGKEDKPKKDNQFFSDFCPLSSKMIIKNPYVKVTKPIFSRIVEEDKIKRGNR